jgi:hypothetical protein
MGYSLFRWSGNWLAIVDLAISTIEIGGEHSNSIDNSERSHLLTLAVTGNIIYYIYDNKEMTLDTPVPVICLLIALLVAAVFRAETMYTAKDRLCKQQFDFLGGCALVKPAYTPWTILHHRFPVIVAFVRERLVDLGDAPRASTEKGEPGDVETQIASPTCDAAERGAGTASEKTPLLG